MDEMDVTFPLRIFFYNILYDTYAIILGCVIYDDVFYVSVSLRKY